ncbi:MAG: hypothetical protein ABR527_07910 [Gemmatimonadota bacterium]
MARLAADAAGGVRRRLPFAQRVLERLAVGGGLLELVAGRAEAAVLEGRRADSALVWDARGYRAQRAVPA